MFEEEYVNLIQTVLTHGDHRPGRNGGTTSIFGASLVFDDLERQSFPLLNGRKIFYKGVFGEFAAFLRGPKSLADFEQFGCNYWKQWANDDGSIDVDYGNQWIDYNGINQVARLVEGIKENPFGRRHIIDSWRPDRIDSLSLPCCHFLYQFNVRSDGRVDLLFFMRSVDVMVGLPSDAVLAALMLLAVCNEVGRKPGKITMMFGDTHIYDVHQDQVPVYLGQWLNRDRLKNKPISYVSTMHSPLTASEPKSDLFKPEDIRILSYDPEPAIKFEVVA